MIRRFNPLYALLPMTVFLGACTTESDESITPITDPDTGTGFVATYKPDVALLPFPTDVWRSGSTDGTLNIPQFESDPLLTHVSQMNMLDGYGLNSAIWADFSEPVNEESLILGQTVFVFRVAVAGTPVAPTPVMTFELGTAEFQGGRSVVALNPTAPLDPLTTYAVIMTDNIAATDGTAASADIAFQAMLDAYPGEDTASDSATVEAIYDGMVRSLLDLAEGATIGAENVVSAWTFTTQSVGASLSTVEDGATSQIAGFVPVPLDPANPGAGIATAGHLLLPASDADGDGNPDTGTNADVFAGIIEMPYYLDPAEPLTGYWEADANAPNCAGAVAAGVIGAASASTTVYCPAPLEQQVVAVPVLLTVPNANSGCDGTIAGVTIFQHGITQSRTNVLPVAGALAQACQAAIAIDLPLHGVTDTTNGLFASAENPLYAQLANLEAAIPGITEALGGLTEQTFNVDVDGEAGIDPSGEYFINLESPITARDALRQAVANLVHLTESIPNIDYNVALDPSLAGPDFTGLPIRFVGHSLGAITGTTYLGVDASVGAAVLVAPGGDIADLLLNSASIYPQIEAGLNDNGLTSDMRFFHEFFRNAQTIIESGDPINYAGAANAQHPILMMEIVGGAGVPADQVVPNSATEKLAETMGLPVVSTTTMGAGVDGLVRFLEGDHGSLLSPAASLEATTEMQTQMTNYIGSGGNAIVITNTSIIAP